MAVLMVVTLTPTAGFAGNDTITSTAPSDQQSLTELASDVRDNQIAPTDSAADNLETETSPVDDQQADSMADAAPEGLEIETQSEITPQAGTTLTTTVSNGTVTSSTEAVVDSNGLYTLTINFESEVAAGRNVVVDIPVGLRLVSGTGIASVGNNTYTRAAYTPSEQLVFDAYPTWASDGSVPVVCTYYAKSGTLTYPIQSGTNGGVITLQFRAESYLYDFSGDQTLDNLVVGFDGLENNLSVKLKSIENDTVSAALAGTNTSYLDYGFPLTVAAGENYPFLNPSNLKQDYIRNLSFDLTYKTGAVINNGSNGWTLGAATDNGDGTSTVHVTGPTTGTSSVVNVWTDGRSTGHWSGTITYPASAGFTVGSSYDTTMSNFTWKTVAVQSDGSFADVDHTCAVDSKTTQTIKQEGDWAPKFQSQQLNWETKNGYDGTQISWLFRTAMMANGNRSFTPVRFRFDADPLDNVSYLTVPCTAQGTVTNVVYKYKDEPETVWSNTSGTAMPGAITYISAGDQWGVAWRFTAAEGKAIEYAYIQYDHDEGVTVGGGGARTYGANVVVGGRPVNDAYTGTFSHHVYSTWQNSEADASGTWTQKTSSDVASDTSDHQKFIANGNTGNDHGGFRWAEPDPFTLTETPANKSATQSFDDTTRCDGYNRPLADFTLSNTSGNTTNDPVRVDFDLDTETDNVSSITFPYSYNADVDAAADQVVSLSWTYTDGSSGTWNASDGTPMPFTPSSFGGLITAPDGTYFASLSVVLDGWNASTNAVTATVTGRPKDDYNYTDRSQHTMTVTQVAGTETELCTGTAGYLWGKLPANSQLGPAATSTSVNAGSSAVLTFDVNPSAGYFTHCTFAIVLPASVTPAAHAITQDQANWTGAKPINWSGQQAGGATLVSSRPATAAEIAQANANTTVDQMPDGSIIYFYEINNQDATYFNRNLGRYTHLGVQIPITANSLAADQVYSFQQIATFGTNHDDGQYSITAQAGTGAVASENLNVGDNGITNKVIRPIPGSTLTINKDPALSVEESIAAGDGVFKTYSSGDNDSIAHFVRDETGTIKLNIYNTVDSTGITVGTGYVFINIPKAASTTPTMVTDHAFDFTMTGAAAITDGAENVQSSEIRYLTSSDLPMALTADALFDAGSTTFDADATMVAMKLVWLNYGAGVEVQIPIKAPSVVSDTVIYDQWQARSVFAFQGSSIAVRDNGEKSGYLRADFQHPEWTLTFDSQGGSAVASDTVEDAATTYDYDGTNPRTKWDEPSDPTWPGHIFGGWFTDAACTAGNEFDFDQTATADTTVYAKWSENTYTVKYDTTGGTPASIADKTNVKWTDADLLPTTDPTRAGYRFTGWNTAEDGTGTSATATSTYGVLSGTDKPATTLYAQWAELPDVTINYKVNDVKLGSVSLDTETVAPASGNPAGSTVTPITGYHLDSWTDEQGNQVSTNLTWAPQKTGGVYIGQNYTAVIKPDTDTKYEVHYFLQDATGTGYTERTADKQDKTGTSDADAPFTSNSYTGFTMSYAAFTNSKQTTEVKGSSFQVAADGSLKINLYYTRNTHDVTFDNQGHGTTPAAQTAVRYGASVTDPGNPTEVGWTFGGWFKDAACTAEQEWDFDTDTMPDSDTTLYASWQRNQYKVNFANDGAHASEAVINGDEEQTVDYEGHANNACTVTITSTPVTDYEVIGWSYDYTAADGTQKKGVATGATGYTSVPILGNMTFHAVIYKVPFVSAAATHGKVSIAQTVATAPEPTEVSAAMEGIQYESLPVSAAVKFSPDSENYELTSIVAKDFEVTPHSIELKKDDGTLLSDTYPLNTVDKVGNPVTVNVTVDLANRTISTDDTIGVSFEFDVVYSPIQTRYTVQHYLMDSTGAYPSSATDTDTMPSATTTIAAGSAITFTPKNYTGATYASTLTTYEDSATDAQSAATTVKFDGSSIVKLYYPRNTFDMTFDVQGIGEAPAPETDVYYQAKIPAPADSSAPGYTFEGWFKDVACTAGQEWDFDTDTMPNADTTLYAKWTELPDVTINYVVASDSTGMGSVTKASELVAPATGTAQGSTANAATGYHFVNWTHDVSGVETQVGTNTTFMPARNSDAIYEADTYAAHFAPDSDTPYEVHYFQQNIVDDGYSEVTADKLDKTGTTATAIDSTVLDKTYTGFTRDHVGYKDSATAESATVLSIAADGSLVVNVYYTRNTHDVMFNANGHGTDPATEADVKFGDFVTQPTNPTASGYIFGGWFTDAACSADKQWNFTTGTMPDADLELYAKWTEADDVAITYVSADAAMGSVDPASESVAPATGTADGSTATPEAGYSFDHWSNSLDATETTDAVLSTAQVDAVAKAGGIYVPVTFTAHFTANTDTPYQVKHYLQEIDGSYPADPADTDNLTGTTGEQTAAAAKSYTGFTAGTVTQQEIDGDGSTVVSIQYTRNSYSLSFDSQGGSAVVDQNLKYEALATQPAAPTRAGYTFGGWYTDAACTDGKDWNFAADTMPAQDTTLFAKWTEQDDVTITYTDDGHGSTDPTSEDVAPATGAAAGSTATADAGYHFVGWKVGDNVVGSDATLTAAQVDAVAKANDVYVATTFTATFAEDPDVAITYIADTGGTISSTGEQVPPATGTPIGSVATPNPGNYFVGWVNADGDIISTDSAFVPGKNDDGIYETGAFTAVFATSSPATDDPPVSKVYAGDATGDATFSFRLSAVSNTAGLVDMPMPGGGAEQSMIATTTGQAAVEFGIIGFALPGTYVYKVEEVNDGQENWAYTNDVYTVSYEVTQDGASLNSVRTITNSEGLEKAAAVFTNTYTAPTYSAPTDSKTDQNNTTVKTTLAKTGDPLLTVLSLLIICMLSGAIMLIVSRRSKCLNRR